MSRRGAPLDDLAEVLATVRAWAGVTEKRPGVFYRRRQPFLHFHRLKDGRRCGDVKGRDDWARLDLPYPSSPTRRRAFMRALRAQYGPTS